MWERPSSQPRRSARAQTATRGGLNDGDDWELVHDIKLKAGDLQTFQHGTSADNAARTDFCVLTDLDVADDFAAGG